MCDSISAFGATIVLYSGGGTLCSVLWLGVANDPWIVSVPDMKGRYFMLPLLDGWTTVFGVPGTRPLVQASTHQKTE
jgi:hypothetical protein